MRRLFIDVETYSPVDIKAGVYRYAEQAELLIVGWAIGTDTPQAWVPADGPPPDELIEALHAPDVLLVAHNAPFERAVIGHQWPDAAPAARWHCTAAQARAHGYPGKLELLTKALKLSVGKDTAGTRLINLFSKPSRYGTWREARAAKPDDWAAFVRYCVQDVAVLQAVYAALPVVNNTERERKVWLLDQAINDRGIAVDVELARAAVALCAGDSASVADDLAVLTGGAVASPKQVAALRAFLAEHGCYVDDLRAGTVEAVLAELAARGALDTVAAKVLRLRQRAAMSSVSKYDALLAGVSSDGRLRGTLTYCGAARTGRWSGAVFQPQNLPKGSLHSEASMEGAVQAIKVGAVDLITDDVAELASSAIRGGIVASPWHVLAVADLSNIEGRVLAWVSGEDWVLDAIRRNDAGVGPDQYVMTYASSFGVQPGSVTKAQRTIGKVQELASGYGGGVGAYVNMALLYGLDLDVLADQALDVLPQAVIDRSLAEANESQHAERSIEDGIMSARTWVGLNALKLAWRASRPKTVALWRLLAEAFARAATTTGGRYRVGGLIVSGDGQNVSILMPSGRSLIYADAQAVGGKLSYMGVHQKTRQWSRIETHGGKLCIASGTPTLTRRGWVPIEAVRVGDELWDGEEWVRHDGLAHNGVAAVVEAFGVTMTPDHEVLTEAGWVRASESEGHHRAACRIPDGYSLPRLGREELGLAGGVRLRDRKADRCERAAEAGGAWGYSLLRLPEAGNDWAQADDPRHEQASGVCGVPQYAGAVSEAKSPGVAELWRPWHNGVRGVARIVRDFLERHGSELRARTGLGPDRQRGWLFGAELPVGFAPSELEQQAIEQAHPNTGRAYDSGAGVAEVRHRCDDDSLPAVARSDRTGASGKAELYAPVYDILNCGPRRRFVVAAQDGTPLIVHNCENITQALARDVLAEGMLRADAEGLPIVLSVHDELLVEVPESRTNALDRLVDCMTALILWAEGLPLAAKGFTCRRYFKD